MCDRVHPLVCLDQSRWEELLRERIEKRAYYFWVNSGCPRGRDQEFWHRARQWEFRLYAFFIIYKMGLSPKHNSPCDGRLPNPQAITHQEF